MPVSGESEDDPFYTVKDEHGDTEQFWSEEFEAIDVPCKWCGLRTTYLGTQECDPCHQIRVNAGINIEATEKILEYVKGEKHEQKESEKGPETGQETVIAE